MEYPDGFQIHAWHGTRVPKEWIEQRGSIDPRLALTWENVEQRRCLAEMLGWGQVIELLSPRVIDTDKNPEIGTLLEVELPGVGVNRFLKVRCGTGRDFVLCVDPSMKTARAANAWTFGLEPGQYDPEVRT